MNPQNQPPQQPGQPNQQPPAQPTQQPGQQQPYQPQMNGEEPQFVYMTRPIEPQRQQISPEIKERHEESKRRYPKLNLSQGEYVITSVRRHPIGLMGIWGGTGFIIILILAVVFAMTSLSQDAQFGGSSFPVSYLIIPAILVSILVMLFGFIAATIYNANRFYLTNESVIQHIQNSLFNQREQTISLQNVEDASFSQDGIMSHLFNYGLIRLSTQGDETTYRFSYASNPQKEIAKLNDAVESFKNVRPIEH